MEELNKQVRRVQWRLAVQRFVGVLGWWWFATLLIAAALIGFDKYRSLGVEEWVWAVAALGVGLVGAIVWTLVLRHRALAAAIELDRRFGLKERVSSTLTLSPDERQTPAGQALVADAVRRVGRVDVGEKFPVSAPRAFLLPLLPGVAALLIALLVEPAVVDNPAEAKPDDPKVQRQIKKTTEDLRRRLAERRKEAEKQKLPEAEQLLKMLEKKAEEFEGQKADRKETMAQLKDLSRELQMRRQKVDAAEEIQKQLEQLKNVDRGPAEKLADALKKGNLPQAMKELDKLKEQIDKGKLGDAEKEQLAKQLDQMKQAMEKMAQNRKDAQAAMQDRVDQMRQVGQNGEADKLEQQLKKLQQQAGQMQGLDKLAEQLGQCAQCMRDGQMQDAQAALQQMEGGLKQLQQQLEEMQLLDDAMDQLAGMRDQLKPCDACGGKGCEKCQGRGFGKGEGEGDGGGEMEGEGDGQGEGDKPGKGLGRGRGQGARPERKGDVKFFDSQVRQKIGEGAADVAGMVDGPNLANRTKDRIQADIEAAKQGSTDPLTGRRLPKKHREHAQEYFDSLREGK